MHTTGKIIGSLYFSGVVAVLMSVFRLAVLVYYGCSTDAITLLNHGSELLVLWALALWCITYANFQRWNLNLEGEKSTMRIISLITGILCWLRAVSAAVYFIPRIVEEDSLITSIYTGANIVLWLAMGVFFLCYWYRYVKADKYAKEQEENAVD